MTIRVSIYNILIIWDKTSHCENTYIAINNLQRKFPNNLKPEPAQLTF